LPSSFEAAAAGLLGACFPVKPPGPGVCRICCTGIEDGYEICYPCLMVRRQLGRDLEPITPVSLAWAGTQIYDHLMRYKGAGQQAPNLAFRLSGLIGLFLSRHRWCLGENEMPDMVVVVPSTTGRQGKHPLEAVVERISEYQGRVKTVLATGSTPIGHRNASATGYLCTQPVDVLGSRILVVDDTLTSNARMQSAIACLQDAGANDVRGVTIGRFMRKDWDASKPLIEWASKNRWDPGTCIHCSSVTE
jgi:predicted amidophosphoribosyltransferase